LRSEGILLVIFNLRSQSHPLKAAPAAPQVLCMGVKEGEKGLAG